jgi:hypothetical protein
MAENRQLRRHYARARTRTLRAPSLAQWAPILIGCLALFIQSFVVQTHIHIPQRIGSPQTVSLITLAAAVVDGGTLHGAAKAPRDRFPITEDPSNCPLCQEVAHSGAYVASAASLAALPVTVTFSFIVFVEAAPYIFAASHTWRGRAPPQA